MDTAVNAEEAWTREQAAQDDGAIPVDDGGDDLASFRLPAPYVVRVNHGMFGRLQRILHTVFGP